MSSHPVIRISPLGFPWETADPFLFCVYHDDAYPRGNGRLGPDATLAGRAIGQDFSRKDGWSMYHGDSVPGFPAHPHRGFETVTVVRKGLIDHADSLGAAARYGGGDVQWLTTGRGVVHSEMFPLIDEGASESAGTLPDLAQSAGRLEDVCAALHDVLGRGHPAPHGDRRSGRDDRDCGDRRPLRDSGAASGNEAFVRPLAPPPDSWAARAEADIAIWTIRMAPGARWTVPAANAETRRTLYLFKGGPVAIGGAAVRGPAAIEVRADVPAEIVNGETVSEFLLLQGRPIGEPVVQHGPFVMNTQPEIVQTIADFQRTRFGGWPWPDAAPVHGREQGSVCSAPEWPQRKPG